MIEFGDKASIDIEIKALPVVEAPLLSFDNVVEEPVVVPAEEPVKEERSSLEEEVEEEKVSDKEIAMMRSQQMLDKFERDDQNEKSFEIEADAISVESEDIDIIDDEPVIQEEPSQEIQVNEAPEESNILIQQKAQEMLAELDLDKEVEAQQLGLGVSMVDDADTARIVYIEKVSGNNYNQMLKNNLLELMNMGFIDFDKNLMLLEKNHNNLEQVCSKMFE